MLGVYEFKTILDIVMPALAQNKLKPSLLSFHFLLFFLSLSLSVFLNKLPYIMEIAKKNRTMPLFAFIIEN